MPYWIHENGETTGPMRAIEVLRRALPTTRVCDGENWFYLDGAPDLAETRFMDAEHREPSKAGPRVTIR
jgi:hypothetical protein